MPQRNPTEVGSTLLLPIFAEQVAVSTALVAVTLVALLAPSSTSIFAGSDSPDSGVDSSPPAPPPDSVQLAVTVM